MKRQLFFSVLAILIMGSLFAQAPQGISHQAVIRDADGKLVTNETIGVKVTILQGNEAGTVVYSETHAPVSNSNGLISYIIGGGTVVEGVFADIDWSDGPYFLKTEVDPAGGAAYSIEGVTQLLSVPYALHAKTSEDAFDGDMKGAPITNLADPTENQDAATKAYVDLLEARIKQMEEVLFPTSGTFIDDRDQQTYKWVRIGDQVWMAEDLKYLPSVVGPATGSETVPYYYVYGYDGTDVNAAKATANYQNYGVLYNWPAAMNENASSSANPSGVQGVCPTGWHIPSDAEWTELVNYVVSQGYTNESNNPNGAGNALKSCSQVGSPLGGDCNTSDHPRWNSHSTHYGTDKFGFSALPGGNRCTNGSFNNIGHDGYWWSATEYSSTDAWYRTMDGNFGTVYRDIYDKAGGFSLRCVRD